jgi:hypothetical protein
LKGNKYMIEEVVWYRGKSKVVLYVHAMKCYVGMKVQLHSFLTSAQVVIFTLPAFLLTGRGPQVPIEQEAGWIPVPVGKFWRRGKLFASASN